MPTPPRWYINYVWLKAKRLFVRLTILVLSMAALVAICGGLFLIGQQALEWVKTGQWGQSYSFAEVWPASADYVNSIEWIGARRIASWFVSLPLVWFYFGVGLFLFMPIGGLTELSDSIESELRWLSDTRRQGYRGEDK